MNFLTSALHLLALGILTVAPLKSNAQPVELPDSEAELEALASGEVRSERLSAGWTDARFSRCALFLSLSRAGKY
jgi:hypothetical protein